MAKLIWKRVGAGYPLKAPIRFTGQPEQVSRLKAGSGISHTSTGKVLGITPLTGC